MEFNYSQTSLNLLNGLPERTRDVFLCRFGLKKGERETLETIGKRYGVTRERVRQIEEDGFLKLKPKIKNNEKVFKHFTSYLKSQGDLKKEDLILTDLGGEKFKNQVYFLLNVGQDFKRFGETEELHPFWSVNEKTISLAQKTIEAFLGFLSKVKKPISISEFKSPQNLSKNAVNSYLEISKKIQKNSDNLFGLKEWPEINPHGIKDKAYLVLKKEQKPLHFAEVAKCINGSLIQTVHNELIKDSRFILIGRGVYALQEWGYYPGQVREVIFNILQSTKKPLTKEEIIQKVLKQRMVKENTILLNLSNKKYFQKNSNGKYSISSAISEKIRPFVQEG